MAVGDVGFMYAFKVVCYCCHSHQNRVSSRHNIMFIFTSVGEPAIAFPYALLHWPSEVDDWFNIVKHFLFEVSRKQGDCHTFFLRGNLDWSEFLSCNIK